MAFGIWLPLTILIAVGSSTVGSNFRTEMAMPNSDARIAEEMLASVQSGDAGINGQIVIKTDKTVLDATVQKDFTTALNLIAEIPEVTVKSPYEIPTQISQNKTIAFAEISVPRTYTMVEMQEVADKVMTASQNRNHY
jgi:hypothetical protein